MFQLILMFYYINRFNKYNQVAGMFWIQRPCSISFYT